MQSTIVKDSQGIEYKQVNDTCYHSDTPDELIQLLEDARRIGTRLIIELGDVATGRAWGDVEIGRIGRSTGTYKIPIVVHNRRSMGGGALLDNCIVRIVTASGKMTMYKHPNYQTA